MNETIYSRKILFSTCGNRTSALLKTINSFKKIRVTRTHIFAEPIYKTVLYKYSCVLISIRQEIKKFSYQGSGWVQEVGR